MSSTSFVMPNDLSDLCRVCLQLPEESQYLDLTTIYDEEDNLTYGECFTICTQINLSDGEGVPHHLCKSCGLELQMSYDFYKKVEESKRVIEQCQKQLKEQKLNVSEQQNKTFCDIEQQHDTDLAFMDKYDAAMSSQKESVLRHRHDLISISDVQKTNDIDMVNKTCQNKMEERAVEDEEVLKDNVQVRSSQESTAGADIEEHFDMEDYQNVEALEEEEKSSIKNLKIKNECDIEEDPLIISTNKQSIFTTVANEIAAAIKIENDISNVNNKTPDEIKKENEILSEYIVSSPTILPDINPPIPTHIANNKNSPNKTTRRKRVSYEGPTFECEFCGYNLPTKNALYQHRLRKHKRKDSHHRNSIAFKCRLCSKTFTMMTSLRSHLDTEHRNVGFVCEHCDHSLPTKNALYQHRLRKHRNMEMTHKKSSLKLKSMQTAENLNSKEVLEKRHTSRKRIVRESNTWFECNDCGHKLPTKNALCQHRLRKHRNRQETKSFRCKYCEVVLNSNKKLQTHLRESHEVLPALKEMVDRL